MNLPMPRSDGICCDCLGKPAETRDGRWCAACLKRRIIHDNPMVGCNKGMYRTKDHRQEVGDGENPWEQNAVRALEDQDEGK